MFARILFGFLLAAALSFAQQSGAPAGSGSFKDGGLEFKQQGGFVYVSEELSGKKVSGAPIILTPNGPMYTAFLQGLPGEEPSAYKQKAVEIYNAHLKGAASASQPVEEARNVPPSGHSSSAPATQIQFDAASKSLTVPLDDGMVVTFKNLDKKKDTDKPVVVAGGSTGAIPGQTFFVKHRGASAGGGLTNAVLGIGGPRVRAGGASSLGGAGPVITMGSETGPTVYDDQLGTVYAGQNNIAKQVAIEVLKASARVEQDDPAHFSMLPDQLLKEMKALTDLR